MRTLALILAAILALPACGTDDKPDASPAASSSAAPAVSLDEVAAHVAEAIGGTVEAGPEVWAVSETEACGGALVDMTADSDPYPGEIVVTDPSGTVGVYVPSPGAECLTRIGEALATVGD